LEFVQRWIFGKSAVDLAVGLQHGIEDGEGRQESYSDPDCAPETKARALTA
jgi:hypothetical protein